MVEGDDETNEIFNWVESFRNPITADLTSWHVNESPAQSAITISFFIKTVNWIYKLKNIPTALASAPMVMAILVPINNKF